MACYFTLERAASADLHHRYKQFITFSTNHGAATIRFLVNGDGVTMQSVLLFCGLGKFLGQKYLAVRCLLFCGNLILETDHLQGILGAAGR